MTAEVTTYHRYQAYCQDCGWFGGEFQSEHFADVDADNHDEEWHPIIPPGKDT